MSVNSINKAADKFLFFHSSISATEIQINLSIEMEISLSPFNLSYA